MSGRDRVSVRKLSAADRTLLHLYSWRKFWPGVCHRQEPTAMLLSRRCHDADEQRGDALAEQRRDLLAEDHHLRRNCHQEWLG